MDPNEGPVGQDQVAAGQDGVADLEAVADQQELGVEGQGEGGVPGHVAEDERQNERGASVYSFLTSPRVTTFLKCAIFGVSVGICVGVAVHYYVVYRERALRDVLKNYFVAVNDKVEEHTTILRKTLSSHHNLVTKLVIRQQLTDEPSFRMLIEESIQNMEELSWQQRVATAALQAAAERVGDMAEESESAAGTWSSWFGWR